MRSKHAIVTGGNRGIGRAIAGALSERGIAVSVLSRSPLAPEDAQRFFHVACDVAHPDQIASAFAAARAINGPVAILINNAGVAASAPFHRTSQELWDRIIATNLTGAFACTRAAIDDMLAAKWGRIVNIASTAGLDGAAYISAYCASKHGVVGFTRAIAAEYAGTGITANAICPGYVETDMMDQAIQSIVKHTGMTPEAAREQLAQSNPQGRIVRVDEVAAAAIDYCQSEATGQALILPGGERA
ncbi:MAG TPA: SDR family oxidoreductase [Verrucomicrobiae bacterium]|jgi:NAD(P)-dependent dehydrogenase (short-subunit alcohol dehydrogenase family)|nr:SDR family oxidoreductase [Verrucomicrobiae bacterium]